jgi:cytidylate kinase
MKAYHELSVRVRGLEKPVQLKPTITLSREFGCEAFPIAEELVRQAEEKTGESWLLVDKSLLDSVAREHNISEEVMRSLGGKFSWFGEMMATFSTNVKNDADYYQLLCQQVVMTATAGNAVIVGLGAAIITKEMNNCFHYRLIAGHEFKVNSVARRMKIPKQDAEIIVLEQQKERVKIIRKLLNADPQDPHLYHAIFNNGKSKNKHIARLILEHALGCK